jgi:ABC-type cobalamin/Fe3+-siderophores transport system ATPase subunit/SAM-dependent methyltransferase
MTTCTKPLAFDDKKYDLIYFKHQYNIQFQINYLYILKKPAFIKYNNRNMRITSIDIPKGETKSDGLEKIQMNKLGDVVLITGKNGSGKTRILEKIIETIDEKPTNNNIIFLKNKINVLENKIAGQEKIRSAMNPNSPVTKHNLPQRIQSIKSYIQQMRNEIAEINSLLNWSKITTNELASDYTPVYFVPKNLHLSDNNEFRKNEIINHANSINTVGVKALSQGSFARIQVIQDIWFNATHQNSNSSATEQKNAINDYNKLCKLISIFLNTSLDRSLDGEATIFGFPLGQSNLSDGQKILLQFCMAIYSQETALKDLILILDEPENHLHPSVIIETIDRIRECNSNGQIWIATHSIPLLAHFDPSSIWYVENGKISHAGKIPEKVLSSLLGNEDEIARLQDFISLPSQFASSRYAFESLFEPKVLLTNSNDPQSLQIRDSLRKSSKSGKIRILDFGAGKGRLLSNIYELDENNEDKLLEQIDYIAFDLFDKDKKYCEDVLFKAYGDSKNRYFNDQNILLSIYDKESFDAVIMCNVLHEIDPKEWIKLFQKDGLISRLLCENGILLLVEDHQIPIGEKAYKKGFLVLDTPELKDLFKISEEDKDFIVDPRREGRLKAHHIPKRCLIRIDNDSRLKAIKSIKITAREKIIGIRDLEQSYQNGKLHGFWTQQFANAELNLAEFS